jgi:hypothetical protein
MSRGVKLSLWGRKNEVSAPQWIAVWKALLAGSDSWEGEESGDCPFKLIV